MTSLNPVLTIGLQMTEALELHLGMNKEQATNRAAEMLSLVGIPNAKDRLKDYPHEFSGGQRQRIALARALAAEPDLIICDEATSALDVSVQAQILNLFRELQEKFSLTYLFIAHDLSVVRHISDRVAVMYLGKIVEIGPTERVFADPQHPYTRSLLAAVPIIGGRRVTETFWLEGEPPDPGNLPSGCRFRTRCPAAIDACARERPECRALGETQVACIRAGEVEARAEL